MREVGNEVEGSWKVVQKPRRGRKAVDGRRSGVSGLINDKIIIGRSQFMALEGNDIEINGDQLDINGINSIPNDSNLELNGDINLELNEGASWKRLL